MAIACFMAAAPNGSLFAAPALNCTDDTGDSQAQAEICVEQTLNAQTLAMRHAYQSVQKMLSKEDEKILAEGQTQWLAYRASYCNLFVQIAGKENTAWQLTWSAIAAKDCEARLTQDRKEQLEEMLGILNDKAKQINVYRHAIDGKP